MPPAFQSFMALQQPPWLPHGRHSVPDGQARATRSGFRNLVSNPTHPTRILRLCLASLPHFLKEPPCVSHPVCCRNVTTAIFGLVGRPPAASGSQTRLRLELVSCGRLPSTHSWSLLICAAVCGVFCDRLWLSEMRVWGVGMRESWEEIVMRLWRLGDGNE